MPSPLTAKQQRFVDEYLIDLNATQAAIRAGYSAKTAAQIGRQLLQKTSVADAIADGKAARSVRTLITADRVLQELAVIGFSDARHYKLGEMGGLKSADSAPESAMRAVASVKHRTRTDDEGNSTYEVEYRLWDKNAALTNLGKHLGLFTEKHEHKMAGGGVLAVPVPIAAEQWAGVAVAQQAALTTRPGASGKPDDLS